MGAPESTLKYMSGVDYNASQNLPPLLGATSFLVLMQGKVSSASRIYSFLPEYTYLSHNYMRRSQNIYPTSKNILPYATTIFDAPRIYPSLQESTILSHNYMRRSQNIYLPPILCLPFPTTIGHTASIVPFLPPSKNSCPIFTTICDSPRIYPCFPEYAPTFPQLCLTLPE